MNAKFLRSLKATKGDDYINVMCQPYCVGMYVAITSNMISGTDQLSLTHKDMEKWSKKLRNNLVKDGFVIKFMEREYTDFISEQDYKEYIEPKLVKKKKAKYELKRKGN